MARPLLLWLTLGWLVALAHANIHQLEKLSPLNPLDETLDKRADTYWLAEVADEGKMPLAPGSYKFYRNVKDYGAKGDGETDDTDAINRAASEGNRCGQGCAGTSTLGALVYFPPGTYIVKKPITQYYYTQFVGDPNDRPVMKADKDFKGISIFDTDPYIPGGKGAQWYINQNQFFRQIRNFVLDMRDMKEMNYDDDGQGHVPVGIHWQVAQATSLQNIKIQMRDDGKESARTAIGIFTENGSGGFVSDLEFSGGFIGFQIGSQQFTVRNLKFTKISSAIQVTWNWGMTWQQIVIDQCSIGFNITGKTPDSSGNGQGVGSLAIIDSTFSNGFYGVGIQPLNGAEAPELLLDNVAVSKMPILVGEVGGGEKKTYMEGSDSEDKKTVKSWAMGTRYTSRSGKGEVTHGLVTPAPDKPSKLLDKDGKYFVRSKPGYEDIKASDWIVVTRMGIANDGTGDQTDAINKLFRSNLKMPLYFPAGIYQVKGTINIPAGIKIAGSGWSNIRGTGSFFGDTNNPKPMVRVGKPGDEGVVEISDMLFTVKGATAGAILMEWNVKETSQGSAAMWDSHFRIGGAAGTDLSLADCPQAGGLQEKCMAASMLLHVTEQASGYFENIWAWTADHDIDAPIGQALTSTSASINIFSARGVLIESKGPTWMYGTASEHNVLYQYELSGAENIYMGHLQTETPYFQPIPDALQPFPIGKFPADPDFSDCTNGTCKESWGMRIIDSKDVFIYSAGMYSFFNSYGQACLDSQDCQERLFRIEKSNHVWVFNIFTTGVEEVVSSFGEIPSVPFNFTAKSGFTSEIGVYLPFAGNGSVTNASVVFVDPSIWKVPKPDLHCKPPCILVLPPSTLPSKTTISFPPLTTTVELGWTTTVDGSTKYVTKIETTTITIPAVTTSVIDYWNYNVTSTSKTASNDSFIIFPVMSIRPPPFTITQAYPSEINKPDTTRTILPPPWPYSTLSRPTTTSQPENFTLIVPPPVPYITTLPDDIIFPVRTWVSEPTTTVINGKPKPVIPCWAWFIFSCPPNVSGWVLDGWKPGVYPPGPPRRPGPPPGPPPPGPKPPAITLPPIPWPKITIGPNLVPTYAPYDPEEVRCKIRTTDQCTTTVSLIPARNRRDRYNSKQHQQAPAPTEPPRIDHVLVKRQRDGTKTTTVSTCVRVTGCYMGVDSTIDGSSVPTATPTPYVIYPKSPNFVITLENTLRSSNYKYYKSESDTLGTIFFFLEGIPQAEADHLDSQSEQLGIKGIHIPHGQLTWQATPQYPYFNPVTEARHSEGGINPLVNANITGLHEFESMSELKAHRRRAPSSDADTPKDVAAISWGEGGLTPEQDPTYHYDNSMGKGTFLYSLDYGAMLDHVELSELDPTPIFTFPHPPTNPRVNDQPPVSGPGYHGTSMMARMAGKTVGLARKATITFTVINHEKYIYENFLDGLMKIHDDIRSKGRGKKAVVNMSVNFQAFSDQPKWTNNFASEDFIDSMARIIKALLDMGVVVVTGAGNRANTPIDGYPAKFKDPADRNHISDIIVVGSTTWYGGLAPTSQSADYIDIWAPGYNVRTTDPQLGKDAYRDGRGTSLSSAVVAGLASYLRGLNPSLETPREVSDLIKRLGWSRPRYMFSGNREDQGEYPKMIWNGQTNGRVSPCIGSSSNNKDKRQADGEACVLPGGGNSGKPLTFSSGVPSPTCSGSHCGSYCTGFFCSAPCSTSCGAPPDNPTQTVNPDFFDPSNPNSCQNPDSPNFGNCDGPAPVVPPCQTTTISGTVGCYSSTTQTPSPTPPPPPPPPPPSDPITPLEFKPVVCKNEADLPGHADISPGDQDLGAELFCEKIWPEDSATMGPGDEPYSKTRSGTHDINYFYEIKWVEGCKTTVDAQKMIDPIGKGKGNTCEFILVNAYKNCNNGGVGGYIDAGCLRYTFIGGQ